MKYTLLFLLAVAGLGVCAAQGDESPGSASSPEMESINDSIFIIRETDDTGVAFLLEEDDGVWLIASGSAVAATESSSVTNARGDRILFPDKIEVAGNHNLIRFQTDRPKGLNQAASCGFEEELNVFSRGIEDDHYAYIKRLEKEKNELRKARTDLRNLSTMLKRRGLTSFNTQYGEFTLDDLSELIKEKGELIDEIVMEINECKRNQRKRQESRDKAVKLKEGYLLQGEVVALGPDRVEISTEITRQDEGGPVLNVRNEVVGVSSHLIDGRNLGLPDWVVEGTPFEKSRQFATRLGVVEWVSMDWRTFRKESSYVRENFYNLLTYARIAESLNEGYYQPISVDTDNTDVQDWIDNHNRMITQKLTYRRIIKDFGKLIEMIEELEKDAGRTHRVSTPYFRQQLSDLQTFYENVRERLEEDMENLES